MDKPEHELSKLITVRIDLQVVIGRSNITNSAIVKHDVT